MDDGFITSFNFPTSSSPNGQIVFSTYIGGSDVDQVREVVLDSVGNIYITGRTLSKDLPTTAGAFQTAFRGGPMDAFVAKISPSGQLLFCTYLGGSDYDVGYGLAVDAAGFIYVSGRTASPDFPVSAGAFQTRFGGGSSGDAFVVKMKPDGSGIVWGTYVGGSNDDVARGRLFLDASGSVYVQGGTISTDFPTTANAAQRVLVGTADGFVFKLSPDGSRLMFSTYLGGTEKSAETAVGGIVVNAAGETYACGVTSAANFPTTAGAAQRALAGPSDVFLVRLGTDGSLLSSTYFGGSNTEECEGLTLDSTGRPIVLFFTASTDFPTTSGAYQRTFGGGKTDLAIAKFSANLASVVFSTYLGTTGDEAADTSRIELDAADNIIAVGSTNSSTFPTTPDAAQKLIAGGPEDCFLVKLSATGGSLLYSTYWGGSGDDFARSVRYRPR